VISSFKFTVRWLATGGAPVRRYHHLGIPTTDAKPGERFLEKFKMYVSGYETSQYGVEWMRFAPGCSVPDLVQRVPHVAFEVDDLNAELAGKEVLIQPNSPSPGVRVAFIVENGAPIEFLQFEASEPAPASDTADE
jgi:hypothetical protein